MKKTFVVLGVAVWVTVLLGGTLFLAAGRVDLPFFWVTLLIWVGSTTTIGLIMDRDLMRERSQFGAEKSGRLLQVLGLPAVIAPFLIAGLDVGRYHWSDSVPNWAQLVGLGVTVIGFGLITWSIQMNRFFAKAVRVQDDRGQRVVTGGPYRYVRHPGYCGFSLIFLASSIALGSWLSILPSLGLTFFFVWRTAMEDEFLQANLDGYAEYAERVRHRLMPGVW
ncbi:isoprenylcysteine carboxylmethyltransferase family protein [Thiohalocapsa sp.]|uniref:methyltransferase family protein n=1 Tax=Thiohalocapsa sp. TaxID=2497641 RepID=UPI0025FE7EA8|nr:isoprenylcysteine carboxylmethyltransferase family protein [Thiohalocapsa sp.]